MFNFSGRRPIHLGVSNGKLAPCPHSPNCVSSQAPPADRAHFIEPLKFQGDAKQAIEKLRQLLLTLPQVSVVEARADYLYAEFRSALMGFVDDVEFWCDGRVIQVRSASRLGYSDLGANRKRIEMLRAAYSI